jgi:PAS domain S-box-containing protein
MSEKSNDYRRMVEEIEDYAIILLDTHGIIRNWNKGAEKIKQYSESEAVGKSFKMFYLPGDLENHVPEAMLELARINGRVVREGWRIRKDGTKFWGSVILTALHDDKGGITGFSKITRDLTERKLVEDQLKRDSENLKSVNEELRKSEERYHRMIAEVEDYAIILLNENGEIQNWNAGAEKIKGYKAEEIVGKNFRIFYQFEDQQTGLPESLINKAAATGKAAHEGWRVKKNGTRFWGSIVITALHNETGEVIGFSKVTRDLTDKKMAEERQQRYLLELEAQNRELERFAYIASHDLQEPLRKIRTFIDLLTDDTLGGDLKRRYFDKILASAEKMSQLIRSILNYSRLGKEETGTGLVDLDEVLAEVTNDFEVNIQEKAASIHSDPLPPIRGNKLQIGQVFTNLIGNALKFSIAKPEITITSARVEGKDIADSAMERPKAQYHEITFSDNGIGFEQQYDKQIFSLFQRLHGKQEYAGTGIGLALCKRIMENHDGFISAQGNPGNGAIFKIYFPV